MNIIKVVLNYNPKKPKNNKITDSRKWSEGEIFAIQIICLIFIPLALLVVCSVMGIIK